jgi:hypothetical protein
MLQTKPNSSVLKEKAMFRRFPCALLALTAALLWNSVAQGQFISLISDFESFPDWEEEVMFRHPSVSGSTTGLDPSQGDLTYLTNVTIDTFSVAHSGVNAVATYWGWLAPDYHSSWVRLTTLSAEEIPNPALHLAGKVRFWAAATAYTDAVTWTPVDGGNLFLGIGVRETGQGVRQGGDGGAGGDIEWVGLAARLVEILGGENGACNTLADPNSDDIQVIPLNDPAGPDDVCVDAGPDNVLQTTPGGDDTIAITPRGLYSLPADGTMRLYEFDLPALEASGNVFPFTGDGTLGATPNNRGTLEQLALTNDPANGAVGANVFLVNIDDVEFEAPVLDPPSIRALPDPPRPLNESVRVEYIKPAADLVEILRVDNEALIGSADPGGQTSLDVPTTPLPANLGIVARQTVGTDVSDNSTPVVVVPAGNGPLRIAMAIRETDAYDHDLGCGDDGTGFDPSQPSNLEFIGASDQDDGFGIPTAPRFVPQLDWFEIVFNPCDETYGVAPFSGDGILDLNDPPDYTNGVWEGLYFRIDELSPTTGPFTVYIDDVTVWDDTGVICFVDDFEGYDPNDFIVERPDGNGNLRADTTAEPTDVQVIPPLSPVEPGQIIVSPGPDGTLETTPAGDDVVSALHARFNYPSVAGTSQGLAPEPDRTAITDEEAYSGTRSLKVEWAFLEASNLRSHLRLTTNGTVDPQLPPETFFNPDPVIPFSLDGTLCDGEGDIYYSVMIKLLPAAIPADCDVDGDVDLLDFSCLQRCFAESPVSPDCATFNIAPNGAPDDAIDFEDFDLFLYLFVGPQH